MLRLLREPGLDIWPGAVQITHVTVRSNHGYMGVVGGKEKSQLLKSLINTGVTMAIMSLGECLSIQQPLPGSLWPSFCRELERG
jgi:hypothetical protein